MSQIFNLKELELQAFRRTFQDGLYDIYLGGLFASFATFASQVFPGNQTNLQTTIIYLLLGFGLSSLIFWLGKYFITLPRIGLVKFGPKRQKRFKDLIWALAVIVIVQGLIILLQFSNLLPTAVREWLAAILGQANNQSLMIAFVAAFFVLLPMLLIGYMVDIPSGYYHAVIMSLAIFVMILLDHAWWMVLGGAMILLPGLFRLIRFIRQYRMEMISDERP
jgi:hypothetical protein